MICSTYYSSRLSPERQAHIRSFFLYSSLKKPSFIKKTREKANLPYSLVFSPLLFVHFLDPSRCIDFNKQADDNQITDNRYEFV